MGSVHLIQDAELNTLSAVMAFRQEVIPLVLFLPHTLQAQSKCFHFLIPFTADMLMDTLTVISQQQMISLKNLRAPILTPSQSTSIPDLNMSHTIRLYLTMLTLIIKSASIQAAPYDNETFSADINSMSSLSVTGSGTIPSSNGFLSSQNQFQLTLSNNNPNGYDITASSAHNGYLSLNNSYQSMSSKKISYKIYCDVFTDSGNATIYPWGTQQLTSTKTLYDHSYSYYILGPTVNAQPYCHITSTDPLNEKFKGEYNDTITITLNDN